MAKSTPISTGSKKLNLGNPGTGFYGEPKTELRKSWDAIRYSRVQPHSLGNALNNSFLGTTTLFSTHSGHSKIHHYKRSMLDRCAKNTLLPFHSCKDNLERQKHSYLPPQECAAANPPESNR